MVPIFDELDYAKKLLENGFVRFMSMGDLKILAKYYRYLGCNEIELKEKLIGFCKEFNPDFKSNDVEEKIENTIQYSKKNTLKLPIKIPITKREIDSIKFIKNYKCEKILFIMLFCAKHEKEIKRIQFPDIKNNEKYFVNCTFPAILSLAKIYLNRNEQTEIKNDLMNAGYLISTLSKFESEGGFEIFYADSKNDDIAIIIEDLVNVGSYYPPYCTECGNIVRKSGLCKNCYEKYRKAVWLEHNR